MVVGLVLALGCSLQIVGRMLAFYFAIGGSAAMPAPTRAKEKAAATASSPQDAVSSA